MTKNKRLIKHSFQLLNVDYVKLGDKWNFRNVISPYYRLYYIDAGEGSVSGPDGSITLRPGYLYLIPSFTLCNLYCDHFLSQYFVQFFEDSVDSVSLFSNCRKSLEVKANENDVANFKRLIAINPGRGINRSNDPLVYEKDVYYKEYTELNNLQSISAQYETQGIILQLISKFLKPELFIKDRSVVKPSTVMDAIGHIQINIKTPLKISQLAARANLSTDYFSRLFHRYTGQSPVNYILQKRIERAQYLIITTKKQQEEIAELTGFDNVHYFSRVFKKMTGLTPGAYRLQNKTLNLID
ncbi:helix-turn-helix domain-containing protein [Pedobacter rhizosphaerae]|uniref:Helix-turn-helix domain-containing protein n=1 Tax=Pedobacter rhizosphaerae TaxID=390241 RepID=A0A1H9R1R1_9SPHI|nr:helix-turn-helix transcriptional regulator [Pedobacter rhizosphaerae]SER66557.1 Helix-turn-helix domain-containing protein [Pedobacter rhizosphaerae]